MVPKDSAGKAPAKKSRPPLPMASDLMTTNPHTGEPLPEGQYWSTKYDRPATRKPFNPDTMCGVPRPSAEGRPCQYPKGFMTDHPGFGWCARHLGKTPNGVKHARRERLLRDVTTYGLPLDIDPEQALLDEVQRTAGHVHWLGARIRKLDPDGLTWGTTKTTKGREARGTVNLTEEQAAVPVLLELYLRERKHLVSVSTAAINAGISLKAVELAKGQATMLVLELHNLVDAIAKELRLNQQRKEQVELLVGGMLRRMASAQEGPALIAGEIIDLGTAAPSPGAGDGEQD